MATFKEKLISRLLKEKVVYHYAGLENMVLDGDMTQAEFDSQLTEEQAKQVADTELNSAYKSGYLDSHIDHVVVESRHIKFLGNERLEHIKGVASRNALRRFGWSQE